MLDEVSNIPLSFSGNGRSISCIGLGRCLRENGARLGLPPATEITFVRGVLLDIGGIAFFRRVGGCAMRNPILRLQQSRDRIVSRRRTPHTGPFLAIFDMDDNRLSVGDGTAECGAGAEGWRTRPALALCFQSWGRSVSVATEGFVGPARRKVAIRRDEEDYVIVLQPEDLVLFRNPSATALRKACNFLRWEVVSDTDPEANDPASW